MSLMVPYDSKQATGHVGLYNQGATCYLNSLLQALFHVPYFRTAVFKMTTEGDEISEIPKALQNLFFQMQEGTTAVTTKCLTDSFGWGVEEVMTQHDIQEMFALLRDKLESKMKGSPAEGAINRLFTGKGQNVVATVDGSYSSTTEDVFYDLHLPIKGFTNIKDSIKSLVTKDRLDGDNKYKVENEGEKPEYKDADKWYEYKKFPPVIVCHLKRFEMDLTSPTLEMKKVNTQFEFNTVLDLSELEKGAASEQEEEAKQGQEGDDGAEAAGAKKQQPQQQEEERTEEEKGDMERGTSFASDSESIYDLVGVIVHRGSVRQGHYYCYMRDYDIEKKSFSPWIEFDDDVVQHVTEEAAINRHYGGTHYNPHLGTNTMATNNAYVLIYMRRADREKLSQPCSVDQIPAHVKEEFERVLRENEHQAKLELERNRSVTAIVVRDEDMARYVRRNTFELVSKDDMTLLLQVDIQKANKWNDAIARVAAAVGEDPKRIRLFSWSYFLPNKVCCWRPTKALPMYDEQDVSTVEEILRQFHKGEEMRHWNEFLYVEIQKEVKPPLVSNIASFAVTEIRTSSGLDTGQDPMTILRGTRRDDTFKFSRTDTEQSMVVRFDKAYKLEMVQMQVSHRNQTPYEATFVLECFGATVADRLGTFQVSRKMPSTNSLSNQLITLHVPTNVSAVNAIKITRQCRYTFEEFMIQRLWVHSPPSEIPTRQIDIDAAPRLTKHVSSATMLIIVKYFNFRLQRVVYIGTCVVESNQPLRNSFPHIRHMIGLDNDVQLIAWDETHAPGDTNMPRVAIEEPLSLQDIINGNIITFQLRFQDIPLVYKFISADRFYMHVDAQRTITVHPVGDPSQIAFAAVMQADWKLQEIVECIGERMNVDPDYIRVYGCQGHTPLTPKRVPESSHANHSLQEVTKFGNYGHYFTDIFYEVLDVKTKVYESQIRAPVAYADRWGKQIGEDVHVVLPPQSTYGQLVQAVCETLKLPFDKPVVLMEYRDSIAFTYWFIIPEKDLTPACYEKYNDFVNKPVQKLRTEMRLKYTILEFVPPGPDEQFYPCGHMDNTLNGNYAFFGPIFGVTMPLDKTVEDAVQIVIDGSGVNPDECDAQNGCLIFTDRALTFPEQKKTLLKDYFQHTKNDSDHPAMLMLNHKKPREKPGSRYVATNDPQLTIEKKKNNKATGGASAASGGASAASAASPL